MEGERRGGAVEKEGGKDGRMEGRKEGRKDGELGRLGGYRR
jgi:hypothetical protein